jgi:hypothetical protein
MRSLIFSSNCCFKMFKIPQITLKLGGLGFFELSYQNLSFLFIFHPLLHRPVTPYFSLMRTKLNVVSPMSRLRGRNEPYRETQLYKQHSIEDTTQFCISMYFLPFCNMANTCINWNHRWMKIQAIQFNHILTFLYPIYSCSNYRNVFYKNIDIISRHP